MASRHVPCPRTLRSAGASTFLLLTAMTRLREFWCVFKLYSRHHSPIYAARIAYGIAFKGLPF